MVQPHTVLEVLDGILDLGVAAMVGLQFEHLPVPVGDEAVIAVGGEEGQLGMLPTLLPGSWSVRDTHPDLAELTEWAVGTRYPGDWPEPTDADATLAESQARSVHDSVGAEFRRRGQLAE